MKKILFAFSVLLCFVNMQCDEDVVSDQEQDNQELITLFDEINELSKSVSCTDASDWTYTAYGSKACGGSQGFIAYSNEIDIEVFLRKIEEYTDLEKAYNIKWGVFSTCDLPQQPSGVKCEDGSPVLDYSSACDQNATVDQNLYSNLDSAHFNFVNAQIVDNCLYVEVSSSGCSGDSWEFKLVDSGEVAESLPEQRYLKFQLTNAELCDAVFKKTVSFDLTLLQISGSNEILLNIEGLESSLNYKY